MSEKNACPDCGQPFTSATCSSVHPTEYYCKRCDIRYSESGRNLKHPKFIQIAVCNDAGGKNLIALDECGGVWEYHESDLAWVSFTDKREAKDE